MQERGNEEAVRHLSKLKIRIRENKRWTKKMANLIKPGLIIISLSMIVACLICGFISLFAKHEDVKIMFWGFWLVFFVAFLTCYFLEAE